MHGPGTQTRPAGHTCSEGRALMTNRPTGDANGPEHGTHWPMTLASLAVGCAFFTLCFWVLPHWLGLHVALARHTGWRWAAAVPSVVGFAVAFRCVWDFGWTGHGTPSPLLPPKRLVVKGAYRYVRNPMYLGFFTGWTGLWVVFGRANILAIALACLVALGVALFVLGYEEPTLRKKFGPDYEEYCRNVRRWTPRRHAWNGKQGAHSGPAGEGPSGGA